MCANCAIIKQSVGLFCDDEEPCNHKLYCIPSHPVTPVLIMRAHSRGNYTRLQRGKCPSVSRLFRTKGENHRTSLFCFNCEMFQAIGGGKAGGGVRGMGREGKKQKKKNSIEIRWSHFPEINKFNNILVNRVTLSSTGFCFLKKD